MTKKEYITILSHLTKISTPNKIDVNIQGPEHTDLKWIPKGHMALLAWGSNTANDALLLAFLWNNKEFILSYLEHSDWVKEDYP